MKTLSRVTQRDRVLAHLRRRKSISQVEATAVHKITRLAARIEELRNAGFIIETVMKRDDAGAQYARYYLRSLVPIQ